MNHSFAVCSYEILMPRSHIHESPRRFHYRLNLTDDPGNANFPSSIRMHFIRTCMIKYYYCTYDYGCNTESYGSIRIATNDAGLYPWLIRRPVREYVTWALHNKLSRMFARTWLSPLNPMCGYRKFCQGDQL